MEASLIEHLLNEVPQALCNVQEAKAKVTFSMIPSGEVRMEVSNTITKEHTRRSQTLQEALPEENVRYMIQQCLQKQPNKKWQAINIDMIVGDERVHDIILIHHYYRAERKKKPLELITETVRLNLLPSRSLISLKMQDILLSVDNTFKKIFSALNYSYRVREMTKVTLKDIKRLQKYLSSSDSEIRPAGLSTMRELASEIFGNSPTITSVSISLLFAVLATILTNVIDAYESLQDVENRLLRTLETKPEIYILMLNEMKERVILSQYPLSPITNPFESPISDTTDNLDTPIVANAPTPFDQAKQGSSETFSMTADEKPLPDEPLMADTPPAPDPELKDHTASLQIRIRHPVSGRCLHVGGKSFKAAIKNYGLDAIKNWSIC